MPRIHHVLETVKYGKMKQLSVLPLKVMVSFIELEPSSWEKKAMFVSERWEKWQSVDRMASTHDAMTRNQRVVFTKISRF